MIRRRHHHRIESNPVIQAHFTDTLLRRMIQKGINRPDLVEAFATQTDIWASKKNILHWMLKLRIPHRPLDAIIFLSGLLGGTPASYIQPDTDKTPNPCFSTEVEAWRTLLQTYLEGRSRGWLTRELNKRGYQLNVRCVSKWVSEGRIRQKRMFWLLPDLAEILDVPVNALIPLVGSSPAQVAGVTPHREARSDG